MLVGSTIVSAVLTGLVRRRSLSSGFVSRPAADRYHDSVIPLGGGIAIFWTLAIVLLGSIGAVAFGAAGLAGEKVVAYTEGFMGRIPELHTEGL